MTNINEFVKQWRSHRNVLLEMLENVTDEQLGTKPWAQAMSFSELVLHIAGAMRMFTSTVKNGVLTKGEPPKAPSNAKELQALVAAATEQTEAEIRSLTPEQLDREIDFFGRTATGGRLLEEAKDHEIHHKGQLFIYLRMAGAEKLPFFVSRG